MATPAREEPLERVTAQTSVVSPNIQKRTRDEVAASHILVARDMPPDGRICMLKRGIRPNSNNKPKLGVARPKWRATRPRAH